MATITIKGSPIVGECFTKDYGTVKLSWTIDNSSNDDLTSVVITRTVSSGASFPVLTGPTAITLDENYLKSGFDSPYAGEWTDTGLTLPMDCTADETFTYTVTLNFASSSTSSFTTGTITIPCCACDATEWGEWSDECDAPDDLELLYRFDTDQQPYIKDETSNFNHGRVRGGAKIVTDVYPAVSTSSLKIPGEGSYVSIPHHSSLDLGQDPFTIDFWIYFNIATTPWQVQSTIFQSANYRVNAGGFRLTFNSGNYHNGTNYDVPYFRYESDDEFVHDSSSGESVETGLVNVTFPVDGTSTATPPTNATPSTFASKTWYRVQLIRKDDGEIEMWLRREGDTLVELEQSSSTATITNIYHGDDGIEIGSSKPGYPSFDGYIDNFRIYRKAGGGSTIEGEQAEDYFAGGCSELAADPKCWDSQDSKLSIWMEGYFENPITGKASFDLKYYLNEKCAWGIGDSRIYFNLPNQASITDFTPSSNLLLPADCTVEEASDGGKYPGRWKLDIAHPAGLDSDFYKEYPYPSRDRNCDDTKVLLKFNQPINAAAQQDIPNYADTTTATITAGSGVEIDLVNKKFGLSSLKFKDEANPYIKLENLGASVQFTNNFIIDFWYYSEDQFSDPLTGIEGIWFIKTNGVWLSYKKTQSLSGVAPRYWSLGILDASSGQGSTQTLKFYDSETNTINPTDISLNKTWYHFAIIRDGNNKIGLWRDGKELHFESVGGNSQTQNYTIDLEGTGGAGFMIGYHDNQSTPAATDYAFKGNIDEFRIAGKIWSGLVGGAYSEFTPPAATTACHDINTSTLLPPTHGTFGTVYIDKPLGEGRICFDTDETKLEVWSRLAGTSGYTNTGYKESITYDSTGNIAKDYNASGLPKWQTGPCLSTCTDEAEIGYGDHYFKPKPFDNNTVDVEYCLTRDNIDTFVIACITTDFKTGVSSIDKEFGDAIDNGWDVKVKNICPGFSIVYGHGEEVISNSGYSTLLRLYLDNNVIQKFPSDPNAKVCMFPLFMKLGNTYDILDDYISKLNSPEMKRLRDSKNAGGKLSNDYETPAFYYNGTDYGSSYSSNANNIIDGWQDGSGFLADLHLIADKIDKRFKQMVHYLADAFEIAIKDYSNTDDYIADDGIRNSAIETAHSFRILYSYWLSLLESYPEFKLQFDSYSKDLVGTDNDFHIIKDASPSLYKDPCLYRGLDVGIRCDANAETIYFDILYNFPLSSISGVEINFDNFKEELVVGTQLGNEVTAGSWEFADGKLLDSESWDGDARDNNYLQAFSLNTNNYICVYGGNISDSASSPANNYLRSDISQKKLPILTTIAIQDEKSAHAPFFDTCNGEEWSPTSLHGGVHNNIDKLYEALSKDLRKAKFVSNEKTTDVVHYDGLPKWTGNSYKASIDDSLDVRDLLTTTMLAIEPNGDDGAKTVDLSEANIESVIKLPIDARQIGQTNKLKTVKNYYNLPSLDLTGITYKTISDTGTYPWVDSDSGKRILSTIDVSNDGIVDIVDVVALRNVWTALGEYPVRLDQVENTILPVVPNEPCTVYDVNAELFSADSCSTFCIADPDCFSKLWISDMIVLRDEEGNPDDYLFEVSYSFDYSHNEVARDNFSGDLSNWTLSSVHGGSPTTHQWSIVDGRMKQGGNDDYALAVYNTTPPNADVRIDVNIEAQDDDAVELILRYIDSNNYYVARFYAGNNVPAAQFTKISKMKDGSRTDLIQLTGPTYGFAKDEIFNAAFKVEGKTLTVYKNGVQVATANDLEFPNAGKVGVQCNNGLNTYFDNFTITDINDLYTIEDFSGVQFKVEGLTGVGIAGTENGTGELDQIDATAVRAKSWDERILSSDATTNDTYFSFSSNAEYITKGKGVLTYLKVSPDSLPDQDEWIEQRLAEGYVKTNRKLKVDSNPILGFLEEEAGMSVSYPMANLRFKSHHTDELMIYEKFGVRIGDPKISYNRSYDTSVDPMTVIDMGDVDTSSTSWTGESGDDSSITNLDLDYVLNLAATNGYEAKFDANEDGKIDIVDVQTINHIVNNARFPTGVLSGTVYPKAVPNLGCPTTDLIAPSLVALDYTAAVGTTLDVVRGGNTRTIDIVKTGTTNQLLCLSDYNYTGGVILYWEYVDGADYYTVYRQSPDEKAVPIISSAPGNAGNLDSFAPRPYGGVKDPVEIMPNFWIDFPPVLTNKCDDSENVVEAEDFKYWVEAVRRSETSKSVEKTKGVVNCRKLPTSSDINFVVEMDQEYNGAFNVTHPYAIPPIGDDATPDAAYPLWMYSQKSGDGNVGISDKGGRIITKSSRPSNTGAEGSNELGFSYKPKKKFIGKDTFKYTATVLDKDLINDPALWCKDDGDVTVYVIPQNPDAYAHVGNCPTPETILKWNSVYGATSYKVYEWITNSYVLQETISVTANTENYASASMVPTGWAAWNSGGCDDPVHSNQYKVTSIAKIGTLELESTGNVITVYSPCCTAIADVTPIAVSQTGYCDSNGAGEPSGRVTISWTDVGGFDSYNVYRRGPFTANTGMADSWELIGDSYAASSGTSLTHEFIDYPDGCVGCAHLYYDYFVRAVDEVGTEGPAPASQATPFWELKIFCCNQDPVAEDQEDETGFGKEITGLQFLANDINNNIASYSFTAPVASEGVVTLDTATGIFGFKPAFNFYGDVEIDWTATDTCGETSNTGTFTITVLPPPDCLIYDYVVCNSKLEFLTYQQDTYGIRKKIATLTQVPFMLNIKGPPSLRGYYGSYTVTGNCGANSNTKGIIVITIDDNSKLLDDVITIITPAGTEITTTATNDPSTGAGEDDSTFEIKSTAPETADEIADVLDEHPELDVTSDPDEPTVTITMVGDGPGSSVEVTDDGGDGGITSTHEDGTTDPLPPYGAPDDGGVYSPRFGCMDSTMFNYDEDAEVQRDGDCEPFIYGCTDSTASNYDAAANTSDNVNYPCVFGLTPSVLFHFNESGSTTAANACASSDVSASGTFVYDSGGKFSTNAAKFETPASFVQQIDFGNTAAGVASQYLTFPDPTIGTSAFTFECWFNSDADAHNQIFFSDGATVYDGTGWGDVSFTTRIDASLTNNKRGFGLWNADGLGSLQYVYWGATATGHLWTAGQGMKHIALVRGVADAVSAGNSQWRLYVDGEYIAPNGLGPQGSSYGDIPTIDMGGQAHQIGRLAKTDYAFNGQMDEIRITKSDTIYTGTGDYTVPTVPFTTTPIVLFHFDGDYSNSGTGGDATNNGTTFQTSAITDAEGAAASDFHINTSNPAATDNTNSLYWDGEFVFDMWVKIDDVGENGTIFKPDSIIAADGMFGLEWLATGAWKLFLGASTELIIADADVADDGTAGTWYHVGITRDGDEKIKFYRDGVGKDMVIPVHGNALYHLDGDVDDSLASADGTATGGCTYSTSGALAGFGQYLNITNPTWNAADATNWAEFPMPLGEKGTAGSGLGAFTLEWFMDASGVIPLTNQKQSFVADAVFWNNSTGTPNPPEGWHFYGYKTWYGTSFMSVLLEQKRGTATDMCRWDYDFTEAGVSGFKHYALVRGVSSGGNSTWRLYIDGWFKDVASGNSTTMTTVDSGVIDVGDNHEKWYIGKRNGVSYTDYGVKDVSFDEVRVTLNDTIYIGTDSSVQAFVPPQDPHSDSGATHTSEDGYDHDAIINPNTRLASAHYKLNEGDNAVTATDEVRGASGLGTIVDDPDDGQDQYQDSNHATNPALFGKELRLNATDTYDINRLIIPNPGLGTGDFTIEWFFNWEWTSSNAIYPLVASGDFEPAGMTGSGNAPWFGLDVENLNGWNKITLRIKSVSGSTAQDTIEFDHTGIPVGHIALVRKVNTPTAGKSTWTLFKNGVAYPGDITTDTVDFTQDICFGATPLFWNDGTVQSAGWGSGAALIDDVHITLAAKYSDNFSAYDAPLKATAATTEGYEVGGASDTPFEGSIDELRIVKDESEEITKPDDPYDCS